MNAKSPADRERALALLIPLEFIDFNWRDEDYEYLRKYPDTFDENIAVVSKDGTDRDLQGMYDLREIVQDEATAEEDRTFEEIALDLATCEAWKLYEQSAIVHRILRVVSHRDYEVFVGSWGRREQLEARFPDAQRPNRIQDGIPNLGVLRDMKVSDWFRELKRTLIFNSYASVETWT